MLGQLLEEGSEIIGEADRTQQVGSRDQQTPEIRKDAAHYLEQERDLRQPALNCCLQKLQGGKQADHLSIAHQPAQPIEKRVAREIPPQNHQDISHP